ncbi:MAG: hypothetical protein VX654_04620, partial [Chloroflexota bacterium]|nr:hypothetical protein [Chloroflexota bacterium]
LENRNTDISSIFPAQFPLEMERPFNENSQFSARNIPLISIDFAQKPEVESAYYFLWFGKHKPHHVVVHDITRTPICGIL